MRRFGFIEDGKDKIHVLRKTDLEAGVKPMSLNNLCAENNMYSIAGPGEKTDPQIEKLFADLFDKEFNHIHEILTDPAVSKITGLDLYYIIAWIISMWHRGRHIKSYILTAFEDNFRVDYDKSIAEGRPYVVHRGVKITRDGKSYEEMRNAIIPWDKPFHNRMIIPNIIRLAAEMADTHVIFINTLKTSAEYITSDNPVSLTFSRDDNGTNNGGHNRHIAVDNKTTVSIRPNHVKVDPLKVHRLLVDPELEPQYALERNQIQHKQSSLFLMGSLNGLSIYKDKMKPILQKIYG